MPSDLAAALEDAFRAERAAAAAHARLTHTSNPADRAAADALLHYANEARTRLDEHIEALTSAATIDY